MSTSVNHTSVFQTARFLFAPKFVLSRDPLYLYFKGNKNVFTNTLLNAAKGLSINYVGSLRGRGGVSKPPIFAYYA